MTPACLPRTRDNLLATLLLFDVEHSATYAPGKGLTWCNRYVSDVTKALDCPIPFRLANDQVLYLDSVEAAMDGWSRATVPEALASLERGEPVVVGWYNPEGHGHIAMGTPSDEKGLHISQAGARCFLSKPVSSGFGSHAVKIWVHK